MVKEIHGKEKETQTPPLSYNRVISEETATKVKKILHNVVLEGTGVEARIPGFTVIGKTGTAQKFDPIEKRYLSSSHIASFIGFVARERPLFSIIAVIDDPKGHYYGGQVAAPLFRSIAKKILFYLGVSPEEQTSATLIASKTWRKGEE